MQALTAAETAAIQAAAEAPMLEQVRAWSAINSGSRNLDGLAKMAAIYADAFSALPGEVSLKDSAPVEAMAADGSLNAVQHGRNLHVTVRPEAPVQLLFTGHMDTVFGVDHPFQSVFWREENKVLGGPGVADMKGGIAVMLAALKAVEHLRGRELGPRPGHPDVQHPPASGELAPVGSVAPAPAPGGPGALVLPGAKSPDWVGEANILTSGHVFLAIVYLAICYSLSRYSRRLETRR